MIRSLIDLPRNTKRALYLLLDLLSVPTVLWLSYSLQLDEVYVPDLRVTTTMALTTFFTTAVFVRIGLYRAVIRYASPQLMMTVFLGVSFSVLALSFFNFIFLAGIPRSVPIIYFAMCTLVVGGSRLAIQSLLGANAQNTKEPVIIYGAGSAGLQLATALNHGIEYQPVAFVDDDKRKHGSEFLGLRVHKPRRLNHLIEKTGAKTVLLAITNVTRARKSSILQYLKQLDLKVQTIPGMADIVSGAAHIGEIRDIEVEDLLGRDPVPPNPNLLNKTVKDKVVMITGAGGSIGSELCRQILALKPSILILVDHAEFNLYNIESELSRVISNAKIVACLGNVRDKEMLERLIRQFKVETIFHAAAYKHVPLVEHNVIAGVQNNIFGTFAAATAAKSCNVKNFILISTDKAVRPTNVMGATKRIAELVLQDLAQEEGQTKFSMVRFGNVLGSSGSVVPLFRSQISRGGPLTVTHSEVTRYFMTIPEAVQLVIQSSAMGTGGDVFVLDMGKPVKIADLAKTMVRLMGKTPTDSPANSEDEIQIEFTGLRHGEKLYEELLVGDNCIGTEHPMITRAMESSLSSAILHELLDSLEVACQKLEPENVFRILKNSVGEFKLEDDCSDNLLLQTRSNIIGFNDRDGAVRDN